MYRIKNKADEFYRFNTATGEDIKFRTTEDFYYEVYKVFDENIKKNGWNWKLIGEDYFLSLNLIDLIRGRIFKEQINFSGFDRERDDTLYAKEYLYYDGFGRIIDIRNYKAEATKMFCNSYAVDKYEHKARMRIKRKIKNKQFDFDKIKFRKDPVPYTGNLRRKGLKRNKKYIRTYKLATDVEYGDMVRRKSVPTFEFSIKDFKRHESWKNSKKSRQWM